MWSVVTENVDRMSMCGGEYFRNDVLGYKLQTNWGRTSSLKGRWIKTWYHIVRRLDAQSRIAARTRRDIWYRKAARTRRSVCYSSATSRAPAHTRLGLGRATGQIVIRNLLSGAVDHFECVDGRTEAIWDTLKHVHAQSDTQILKRQAMTGKSVIAKRGSGAWYNFVEYVLHTRISR